MLNVITTTEQITPEAMATVLRNAGVLPQGEVHTVEFQANPAFNSTITHLELTFSTTAPRTAPRHLLLKRNLADSWAVQAGAREVAFYQTIARLPDRLPMSVRCYDAIYNGTTGNSHVLLQDLSTTHRSAMSRDQQLRAGQNMPAAGDIDAVVNTLARFHAYWWDHALLGTPVAQVGTWWQDQANYAHEIQRREAAWADLIEGERTWFPEHLQRLYEVALAGLAMGAIP